MEMPSGHPQSGSSDGQGNSFLQPRSENQHNTAPASNPPVQHGSTLQIPRGPPPSSRSTTLTGRKTMSSNHKVAIPRQRTGAAPRYSRRVPLACETCRLRKTKCSGDTPICRQCAELRAGCRYPVSWRERTKGSVLTLTPQATDLMINYCF
jgi:hypothetical protein